MSTLAESIASIVIYADEIADKDAVSVCMAAGALLGIEEGFTCDELIALLRHNYAMLAATRDIAATGEGVMKQ